MSSPKKRAQWRAASKRWRNAHPDRNRLRVRTWRTTNPEKVKAMKARHYQKHKTSCQQSHRRWKKEHPERILENTRIYYRQRIEADQNWKLRKRLATRVYNALKHGHAARSKSTLALLGCDIQFLRGFVEARFTKGMSWDNYGKWHIDHIIPCAEFDLRDISQQKRCFHYTNLWPRWATDNRRKGAKCPPVHQWGLL